MVIKKIKQLINDPEFKKHQARFTLVLDEFEELEDKIKKLITPHNGHVVFNEQFCDMIADPLHETMEQFLEDND